MLKKIAIGVATLFLLWMIFIWAKYKIFYYNPSQEKIEEIFAKDKLPPPVYDSIYDKGYSIKYLTNKLNDTVTPDMWSKKRPYLVLLHDAGKNASCFLDYFKNKNLNKNFHIIAIDRLGFGKTTFIKKEPGDYIIPPDEKEFGKSYSYVSQDLTHKILQNEGQYLDEVRVISEGSSAILGLNAYRSQSLGFNKFFLVNPDLSSRFGVSKIFSKIVSVLSFIFPRPFVSKQEDLLLADQYKEDDFSMLINFAKEVEKDENQEQGLMTHTVAGMFKGVLFFGISDSQKKKVTDVAGDSSFVFEKKGFDLYKNPEITYQKLMQGEDYTIDFNSFKFKKKADNVQ